MGIVNLLDILPLHTTDVKLSGRKPRKKDIKTFEFTNRAWMDRLEAFLKYCGWSEGRYGLLTHPQYADFVFDEGDFIHDHEPVGYIDKECADIWQADDVNFLLFKETKMAHFHERTEIKLK